MKIGLVTIHNVMRRPHRTAHYLHEALAAVASVEHLEPRLAERTRQGRIGDFVNRRLRGISRHDSIERSYAAAVGERCGAGDLDLLVALYGSNIIPRMVLPDGLPLVHISDTTLPLIAASSSDYPRANRRQLRQRLEFERLTCRRADLAVYPSEWARDSAVRDCGLDPDRAHVIEWGGAGEGDLPELDRRPPGADERIELLFIGQAWRRKGLDRLLAAAERIERQGRSVLVTSVGTRVPRRLRSPLLREVGSLALDRAEDRERFERLLAGASCLVHPARSECYGHVLVEAAARGVPVVCTRVGGMPTIVRDGENGLLVDADADAPALASTILRIVEDPMLARTLSEGARRAWSERLSWASFGRRFVELVRPLVSAERPGNATGPSRLAMAASERA